MEELLLDIIDALRTIEPGADEPTGSARRDEDEHARSARHACETNDTPCAPCAPASRPHAEARDAHDEHAAANGARRERCAARDACGLSPDALEDIIRRHNRGLKSNASHHSKKKLLPFYLNVKENDPARWASWNIDAALETRLLVTLRVKPRRTASGVATVTVITKPHACKSACLYCPNDVRMPKSYLASEPACQRAERTWFDPYLQVNARLSALANMGHTTDKVELIVLGGTWDDYPESYRIWFAAELFRALNEAGTPQAAQSVASRKARYRDFGIDNRPDRLETSVADIQRRVNAGELSFNRAMDALYGDADGWQAAQHMQHAELSDIDALHARNESARHRCVGLVIETRPDCVTAESLALMRRLGCTKIQMGVQSLDDEVLRANRRGIGVRRIARAFALARLFGFKTHAHFMANLYAATPEGDIRGYERLMRDADFMPDEVKMYPCALIESAALIKNYRDGSWAPYGEDELVGVLVENVLSTPPWTRISRMIRDFSAGDIVDGNKKVNLRQIVEERAEAASRATGRAIEEIRHRELNSRRADAGELALREIGYATSTGREVFLQWVTPDNAIAGFLRLSLPCAQTVREAAEDSAAFPIECGEAMIREVHVYGAVAGLHQVGRGAQHLGLGRALIARACEIARDAGYGRINVISAVGTREYYRAQGFEASHGGLYQQRPL